jgi:hypothetical protein
MPNPGSTARCGGPLRLQLLLNSPTNEEEPLQVNRCETCKHFEWISEPTSTQT